MFSGQATWILCRLVFTVLGLKSSRHGRGFTHPWVGLFARVPEGEYGLLFTDGSKFGRAEQLHMALLGLWAFEKREKRLPKAGNPEEAEAVVKLAEEVRVLHFGETEDCFNVHT